MHIKKHLVSSGCMPRVDKTGTQMNVDMLVLHCAGYPPEKLIQVFINLGVAAHYLIDTDGSVIQLVEENHAARHAGIGSWYGREEINFRSIGIEVLNPGLGHLTPYTSAQIRVLKELSKHIIKKYGILPHDVIGHSDYAPVRKYDPGRLFPWQELAAENIGLWSTDSPLKNMETNITKLLLKIGYSVQDEAASLRAFLRHFMPEMIPDQENPDMDQYQFLLEYDKNLPTVADKLPPINKRILQRLNQVAAVFEKSRKTSYQLSNPLNTL